MDAKKVVYPDILVVIPPEYPTGGSLDGGVPDRKPPGDGVSEVGQPCSSHTDGDRGHSLG